MSNNKKLLAVTHEAIAKALASAGDDRYSRYFGVANLLETCAFVFNSPELKAQAQAWRQAARRLIHPLTLDDIGWD